MIYVASSWRNKYQPGVVGGLIHMGLDVYDFRNEIDGFHWSDIDPEWESWSLEDYRKALEHPLAKAGFDSDFDAMKASYACLLVLPCGRSAHLEAGWFVGQGRPVFVYSPEEEEVEPELMYKMCTMVSCRLDTIVAKLIEIEHTK